MGEIFIVLLVKLVFMPEGAVIPLAYPMNESLSHLRNYASSQCGQPANSIIFLFDGKSLVSQFIIIIIMKLISL